MAALGSVTQVRQANHNGPLPLQLWKVPVVVPAAATTVTVTSPNKLSGTVVAAWIDPVALAENATVKVYDATDEMTTPTYAVNYTQPAANAESKAALYARCRVMGTLTCVVASAVATNSFTLYVWVDPNAETAQPAIDIGDVTLTAGTALIGKVGIDQATANANEVVLKASSAAIGSLVQPVAPAETVVAGAASTLGKIGTTAAAATVYVRCPCAATTPATSRVKWRVSADKAHTVTKYLARTVVNAPTITLASVQANDTVIINGLTFTAHANTTVEATGQFKIDGATDTLDADELVKCINTRFAALGLTADAPAAVITLTATTATTTQCVTGVGGARIVCAQGVLINLEQDGSALSGLADNSTTKGMLYDQYVDGYQQAYLGITNNDGAAAMTLVVGATLLAV